MRKLLLLLPLMALASCSGGHDLMSNEPSQWRCEAVSKEGVKSVATLVASPELRQATYRFNDQPTKTLNVVGITPIEIKVELFRHEYWTSTIAINRESGEVRVVQTSPSGELLSEQEPPGSCTFKSL
jgi:hypothetical protein